MSSNNEILYDYLSLYRQHLNTVQTFFTLNNNIIIGINNTISSIRNNNINNRPFNNQNRPIFNFGRPSYPPPPPPPPNINIPPPPPPPNFNMPPPPPSNFNMPPQPSRPPTRRRPLFRNRINSVGTNTRRRRNSNRNRVFQPFFFNATIDTNNLRNTLNNSLYDTYPQISLPREEFDSQTTSNTWENIRNIHNLSENQICPITRENFNNDTTVSRINHCGHIFTRNQLLNWFQFDTRCPICRYNLSRENEENQIIDTSENSVINNNSINNIDNSINNVDNSMNNVDNSMNNVDNSINNVDNSINNVDNSINNVENQDTINPLNNFTNLLNNTFDNYTTADLNHDFNLFSSAINNPDTINDISENLYSITNEIANNVMNVFTGLANDNSNNTLPNNNMPYIFNNFQQTFPNNTNFPGTNYNATDNPFSFFFQNNHTTSNVTTSNATTSTNTDTETNDINSETNDINSETNDINSETNDSDDIVD